MFPAFSEMQAGLYGSRLPRRNEEDNKNRSVLLKVNKEIKKEEVILCCYILGPA